MRRLLLTVLASLVPLTAQAEIPPLPAPAKLPPAKMVSFAAPPASITCAEGAARLVEGATPAPKVWQPWTPPVMPAGMPTFTPPPPPTSQAYSFSVDGEGRVFDLKRIDAPTPVSVNWLADEQTAVVASWRFAIGAPATGCKIDLAPTYMTVAEASPAKLFEVLANEQRNAPPSVRKVLAAGSDCEGGAQRRPNVITYPDLRPFDDKTVDPAWSGVRYDIDASGAVRNVRIAAQHGEQAFSDAVAASLSESRFFPGQPRHGCFLTYHATPKATLASKAPAEASFKRPGDTCDITQAAMNLPENKMFPPAFGKRRVAGWAVIRFDVAPWGQVGAVEVLAAQPTAAFGDAARAMVQSARPTPPPSGYRGCIVPVTYAIPAILDEGY